MSYRLLVIDGEQRARESLQNTLSDRFEMLTASDGAIGIELAVRERPDLILLELLLPGSDGVIACRTLKSLPETRHIPIIVTTSAMDDERRAEALIAGADDLVSKSIARKELLVRILSKLRRVEGPDFREAATGPLACGNLTVDPERFEAKVDDRSVPLTLVEVKLLSLFIRNIGKILVRQRILSEIWADKDVSRRVVDNHILLLRKKLCGFNHCFVSVYGAGYGLKPSSE